MEEVFPPAGNNKFGQNDGQRLIWMTLVYSIDVGDEGTKQRTIRRLDHQQMRFFLFRELFLPGNPGRSDLFCLCIINGNMDCGHLWRNGTCIGQALDCYTIQSINRDYQAMVDILWMKGNICGPFAFHVLIVSMNG